MTESSLKKLDTCCNEIKLLVNMVANEHNICVVCGYRNAEEQEAAFDSGASPAHWGQSPHNKMPSKAVDLAPLQLNGKIDWSDTHAFKSLAVAVKNCASKLGIEIVWGGDFHHKPDMPHYELKDWNK